MIVLDASAVVDLLLSTPPHAARVRARIVAEKGEVAVPHLVDVEVGQVLRRFVRAKAMSASRAKDALTDLGDLPFQRHPHGPLLGRAFDLRDNVTIYDAVYVVLAAALDVPLLTRDARLARLPLRRIARIEVLRD